MSKNTFSSPEEAHLFLTLRQWKIEVFINMANDLTEYFIKRPHDLYVPDDDEWDAVKYLVANFNGTYLRREEDERL